MARLDSSRACAAFLVLVAALTAFAPAAPAATDPYAPDPAFPLLNDRSFIVGGGASGATAVAVLPDGDIVTAGTVYSGSRGIWLLRHHADGSMGQWLAPTPGNAGTLGYTDPDGLAYDSVTDLKVFADRIYVLANRVRSASVSTHDVYVLVFDLDGNLVTRYLAMGNYADEYGAGMVVYQTFTTGGTTTWVSVVGHRVLDSVESNPFLTRASWQDGSLVRDTSIGDTSGYVQFPVPATLCSPSDEACSMEVASVVVKPSTTFGLTPTLYVGGSVRTQTGGSDWDFAVLCTSASGNPCSGFGNGGFVRRAFNDGGSIVDKVSGIAVRRFGVSPSYVYTVYLVGNVARRCSAGIGVAALDGDSGDVQWSFGDLGKVIVGGSNGGSGTTPICFINVGPDVAAAATLSGDRLAIVGHETYTDTGGTTHTNAQTVFLDPSGNVVSDLTHYAITNPNSGAASDSRLLSVRADSAGRFLVGGQAIDATTTYQESFVSGRFVRDRIFANGFD